MKRAYRRARVRSLDKQQPSTRKHLVHRKHATVQSPKCLLKGGWQYKPSKKDDLYFIYPPYPAVQPSPKPNNKPDEKPQSGGVPKTPKKRKKGSGAK